MLPIHEDSTYNQTNYSPLKSRSDLYKNYPYFSFCEPPTHPLVPMFQLQNVQILQGEQHYPSGSFHTEEEEPNFDLLSIFFPEENQHDNRPILNTGAENEIKNTLPKLSKTEKIVWLEAEDKMLKELVVKYKFDWKRIAKRMYSLTNKKYTVNFLKKKYRESTKFDNIKKRVKFSHEEDLQLVKSYQIYGLNWEKIASSLERRTPMMVKNRFYSYIKKKGALTGLLQELETTKSESIFSEKSSEESSLQITQGRELWNFQQAKNRILFVKMTYN